MYQVLDRREEGKGLSVRMEAKIEVLLLPYDSSGGASMLARLTTELNSGAWTRFRAAVAFARSSGNDARLLDALQNFAAGGGVICLTFGADTFAGNAKGSDYDAIAQIISSLDSESTHVYLYHEQGRTFHPKVYLFDNSIEQQALLIIGSSNWGEGGSSQTSKRTLLFILTSQTNHMLSSMTG